MASTGPRVWEAWSQRRGELRDLWSTSSESRLTDSKLVVQSSERRRDALPPGYLRLYGEVERQQWAM